ncbi:MAG: tetratricopeptide repeat protein [Thermoanaerobaculia bacterium]
MLSILIWGRRAKSVALAAAGERFCERCGLLRAHTWVVDYTLNHLYYIFGFVSGRKLACRCTICGQERVEVADPALEARVTGAIPTYERFGCAGLGIGLAALILAALSWSHFGPQPRNIPELLERVQGGDAAAMARLEKEAESGDLPSQLALAQILRDGLGVPANEERAFGWALKAAQQGSAPAQFAVGAMYEWGKGTASDPAEAASWYRKAADQGVAGAANCLGALYLSGLGVEADAAAAVGWFRKAAEGGDTMGQFNLAMRYFNGEGVAVDPVESRRWLERAAVAQDQDAPTLDIVASSKQELGVIYEEGMGVEKDLVKALRFYEEASPRNEDAELNFARLKARLEK